MKAGAARSRSGGGGGVLSHGTRDGGDGGDAGPAGMWRRRCCLGSSSRAAPAFTVRRAVLFHSSWVYKVLVSPHEVEGEKKRPGNEGVGSVCDEKGSAVVLMV